MDGRLPAAIHAPLIVTGRKIFGVSDAIVIKKIFRTVIVGIGSKTQPRHGMVMPASRSQSRSPGSGIKARFELSTNSRSGPDALTRGRFLIILRIGSAEYPVQFGDAKRGANARVSGIFNDGAGKMCLAETAVDGQPRKGLELIVYVCGHDAAQNCFRVGKIWHAAVIERHAEKLIVGLCKGVEAGLELLRLITVW